MPFDTVLVLYRGLRHSDFIQRVRAVGAHSKHVLNKIDLLKLVVISVSERKVNYLSVKLQIIGYALYILKLKNFHRSIDMEIHLVCWHYNRFVPFHKK